MVSQGVEDGVGCLLGGHNHRVQLPRGGQQRIVALAADAHGLDLGLGFLGRAGHCAQLRAQILRHFHNPLQIGVRIGAIIGFD